MILAIWNKLLPGYTGYFPGSLAKAVSKNFLSHRRENLKRFGKKLRAAHAQLTLIIAIWSKLLPGYTGYFPGSPAKTVLKRLLSHRRENLKRFGKKLRVAHAQLTLTLAVWNKLLPGYTGYFPGSLAKAVLKSLLSHRRENLKRFGKKLRVAHAQLTLTLAVWNKLLPGYTGYFPGSLAKAVLKSLLSHRHENLKRYGKNFRVAHAQLTLT